MKLKLKNTPEQVELIKAIGSRDGNAAREASEAFAAFLGPVIQKVLYTAGTAGSIYVDSEYDEDDSPSYPLDLYYDESAGYVNVWSQTMAGGLPTSHVEGMKEVKIQTYRLDSAVSFNKRYARKARLDVVSKAIERMANEVLVKQERNAWAVILRALIDAKTAPGDPSKNADSYSAATHLKHVYRTVATGSGATFDLSHLNGLMTRIKRLNESFSGSTPAGNTGGLTDLYISPEIMEQIRAFSYNPVHTSTGNDVLPNSVREDVWRNAGMANIYGVNLNEMVEFGRGKKYNKLFDTLAGSDEFFTSDGSSDNAVFTEANDELIVGLDNSRGSFVRPIARNGETGSTFTALPDEQFNMYGGRVERTGFYGHLEEGRLVLDARSVAGLIL